MPDRAVDEPPGPAVIPPGATLMRRVPDQPKLYRAKLNPPLQQGAFLPRNVPHDKDGLSLSRPYSPEDPDFLTPAEFRANCTDSKMRQTAGVAFINVDAVREVVGPLVHPDPTPADPERNLVADQGHVVIPEINSAAFWGDNSPEGEQLKIRIRIMAAELVHRVASFPIVPGAQT